MDDEHVLAGVEAVDQANLYAVHILALDTVLGDDVGHDLTLRRLSADRRANSDLKPLNDLRDRQMPEITGATASRLNIYVKYFFNCM